MIEQERYELFQGPAYRFEPHRRDFFKLLGGGIVVLLAIDGAEAQESGGGARRRPAGQPQELSAWLHVGDDGRITFFTGKAEVGQNTRTSLTQAVAEELNSPASSIRLLMADTDLVPFDMGTFGSLSTPQMAPLMRRAAATAREWLIDLVAERFACDRASLAVEDGAVREKGGKTATFAELVKGRNAATAVAGNIAIAKPRCESVPKVDGRAFVTGAHKFASDIKRPGMLHGKVLRAPSYGAKLVSVTGATVRDGDFAGVVGEHPSADEMQAEWSPAAHSSSKELYAHLRRTAGKSSPRRKGDVGRVWERAAHKLEATYHIAYIAHIPLEPRAAVAEWTGGKLTVWTGTQRPFGVRSELALAFQIPETKVRVIVPDTGSGYGGKHTGECALEAARLAKAAGKPVKVVWTRQEEFTWAYWRPAGVIDIHAALDKSGIITAWEFHNFNSGTSSIDTPYATPHTHIEFHPADSPLRQGSYRGLAATANNFARESHIDDLAKIAGIDALQFRYNNLGNERMKGVLAAAAERFGWGKAKAREGRGSGIACGFEKNGYVATCAEVMVVNGRVTIERLVTAFDCGAVVNPNHLKQQIDGAVIMGIGGAMFEHGEFENGKLITDRLSRYRVPRFSDVPAMETVLVDRKDIPSAGAGETPIIGVAPAIANAIYAATGERRRHMPLDRSS